MPRRRLPLRILVTDTARFIDSFGFQWQVIELRPSTPHVGLADRWQPGWLYFCSRGSTLVLREYPRDWSDLEWQELDALRRRAKVLSSDVTRVARASEGALAP
jgi:hypothetical protein